MIKMLYTGIIGCIFCMAVIGGILLIGTIVVYLILYAMSIVEKTYEKLFEKEVDEQK